jgi:hypothetical protein
MVITSGDVDGPVVFDGVTDADGRIELDLQPGNYVITASEVEGLTRMSEPFAFTVRAGEPGVLTVPYDTGMR